MKKENTFYALEMRDDPDHHRIGDFTTYIKIRGTEKQIAVAKYVFRYVAVKSNFVNAIRINVIESNDSHSFFISLHSESREKIIEFLLDASSDYDELNKIFNR